MRRRDILASRSPYPRSIVCVCVCVRVHLDDCFFLSRPSASSPWRFPWSETLTVLDKDKSAKPYAIYHYHRKNNRNKQHLSDTISAQAERIAPGHMTPPTKETCSFIYHVESGEGTTKIVAPDGTETDIHWTARDTFAVPAWSLIRHTCTSDTDAYLFAINDRPVVESLGLFRSE
jgi:gentisate 1,2-dioxygenase